jgi:formylglycine-generating enzyme required for sulfatase activity
MLKETQITNDTGTLLLIFDQFEELFTYPPKQIQRFAENLAEVFYSDIPERYRKALEQNPGLLSQEQLRLLHEPLRLRVITAIRTDRMALMHQLKPFLPNTLDAVYELKALSRAAAEEAVLNPAYDPGEFATPRFDYDDEALDALLDFLSAGKTEDRKTEDIESFQLQILCEHLEKNVVERAGRTRITAADIADPERILEDYYLNKIEEIPEPATRLAARRLIEEGLIFEEEERRLTLFEGQILRTWGVDAELLARLEDTHLLRREPSLRGGYTYELSHDTLVAPVLKAKSKRMAEERKAEEARQSQEVAAQLAAEKAEIERKRRRALITAFVAGALVLAAVVGIIYALWQRQKAQEAIQTAKEKTELAQKATDEADSQKQLAEEKTEAATAAEAKAKLSEEIADLKEKEAQTATDQALLRKKEAELASLLALEAIMEQQLEDILRLRYDNALTKLKRAADLAAASGAAGRVLKDTVAYGLMETAFFYHHSGSPARAREPFDLAARLLGKPALAAQAGFDAGLKRLDAGRAAFLQRRYFPFMQELPGVVFLMGRDSTIEKGEDDELPRHEVQLSPFGLAQTETSFWQWNLYIAAKGRDIQRYSPSWGIFGDNPAVNLDWFDACEYANWLSEREGKKPFYKIDSTAGPDSRNKWIVSLLPDGNGYRLPTEAEWEYAARGGPGAPYYTYAGGNDLDAVTWFAGNSRIDGVQRTRMVRQKKPVTFPNGAELYDLTGNVWEWCWDAYDETYYEQFRTSPTVNPTGPDEWGIVRVLRGGSWFNGQLDSRVSSRRWNYGEFRFDDMGFRLALHQH